MTRDHAIVIRDQLLEDILMSSQRWIAMAWQLQNDLFHATRITIYTKNIRNRIPNSGIRSRMPNAMPVFPTTQFSPVKICKALPRLAVKPLDTGNVLR